MLPDKNKVSDTMAKLFNKKLRIITIAIIMIIFLIYNRYQSAKVELVNVLSHMPGSIYYINGKVDYLDKNSIEWVFKCDTGWIDEPDEACIEDGFLYYEESGDLCQFEIETSEIRRYSLGAAICSHGFSVSPDQNIVAYVSYQNTDLQGCYLNIFNMKTSTNTVLYDSAHLITALVWNLSGDHELYFTENGTIKKINIDQFDIVEKVVSISSEDCYCSLANGDEMIYWYIDYYGATHVYQKNVSSDEVNEIFNLDMPVEAIDWDSNARHALLVALEPSSGLMGVFCHESSVYFYDRESNKKYRLPSIKGCSGFALID